MQPTDSTRLKAEDYPTSLPYATSLLPERSPDLLSQQPAQLTIRQDQKAKPGLRVVAPALPGYTRLQMALEKYTLLEKGADGERAGQCLVA